MVDIDMTQVDTTDNVSSVNLTELAEGSIANDLLLGKPQPVGLQYLVQQCCASLPRMLADVLALTGAGLLSILVGAELGFVLQITAFGCAALIAFLATGQYPATGTHPAIVLRKSTLTCAVIALSMLLLEMANGSVSTRYMFLWASTWTVIVVMIPLLRFIAANLVKNFNWATQPVLILGSDYLAGSVYRALDANRKSGLRPLGIVVDAHAQWEDSNIDPSWVIGTLDEISLVKNEYSVFTVVNAVQNETTEPALFSLAQHATNLFPIRLSMSNAQNAQVSVWDSFVSLDRFTLVKQTDRLLLPIHRMAKRFSDIVLSCFFLILLSPLIAGLAIAIRINSRGSIFFKNQRIGSDGKLFQMTKFRSMYINGDEILARFLDKNPDKKRLFEQNVKLENDPRVTPVGHLLRRTSLDELPQLFDVLRGTMSLVGPRPMLPDEKVKYGDVIQQYRRMLPGITGLWQVSGRNNTSYEQRLHCVNYYVQNWSPWLDLCILARTVLVVLKKEGAY